MIQVLPEGVSEKYAKWIEADTEGISLEGRHSLEVKNTDGSPTKYDSDDELEKYMNEV